MPNQPLEQWVVDLHFTDYTEGESQKQTYSVPVLHWSWIPLISQHDERILFEAPIGILRFWKFGGGVLEAKCGNEAATNVGHW